VRQPHAGMAVAEPVAQVDHLHSCPSLSGIIPSIPSLTSFSSFPRCSMLTGRGSKEDLQRLPRQGRQCRQALVPTALLGVLRGMSMPDTGTTNSGPGPTLEIRVNLAAILHSAATDLAEVANGLAGFSTDDEIEQQARILDRIAEDISEDANTLRALIVRRERVHGPVPRRVPHDAANVHRFPPSRGGGAS
jgi:hypothetical protein